MTLTPDTLLAANVNPATGLATDYLNHFNEVAMLVDMLASMPEAAEDILAWAPRPYAEHFRLTGYSGAAVAAAAYEAADPGVRERFDAACGAVEAAILAIQAQIHAGEAVAEDAAAGLYALISDAGGVINGEPAQSAIDALFD